MKEDRVAGTMALPGRPLVSRLHTQDATRQVDQVITRDQATLLRRLTIGDHITVRRLLTLTSTEEPALDRRVAALARLGALVAVDAAAPAYQAEVRFAHDAGASTEEILGVLLEVAPLLGSASVTAAAPKLALALGYDVETALGDPYTPDRDLTS